MKDSILLFISEYVLNDVDINIEVYTYRDVNATLQCFSFLFNLFIINYSISVYGINTFLFSLCKFEQITTTIIIVDIIITFCC